MIQLATFLTAYVFLGIAHGEGCKDNATVGEVLAAVQTETYFLTGTTNKSREACSFLSGTGLTEDCVSGTPVTYGYKNGREWVNNTDVVEKPEKPDRFPSRLSGPLKGMRVVARGENCFTLRKQNETEVWVAVSAVDVSTCCKEKLEKKFKDNTYATTYEHGVC
uniref:Putative salivary lipocalin n=1 Tax=Ornithodoros turicata TaxID=34597 RepID=A0A2R5L8D1_9ACAR